MGVSCRVLCDPTVAGSLTVELDIPATAAARLTAELRAVGTVAHESVSWSVTAPASLGWQFKSGCDDRLLLNLYDAARREFTGQSAARDVILYQRTDNRSTAQLAQLADFVIRNNASFTTVSPTTYQVTGEARLAPWAEHDEAFAAQFLAHGLRVLPLIWADCAAHPRPADAFRAIMRNSSQFVNSAIERAHLNGWSGYVLDWEPTGNLTLEDSQAFARFIGVFAGAMRTAAPPLELHVYGGWEHQAATKAGMAWRAHWFNYSLDHSADFLDVGITYDHSPHQASNLTDWKARLQCVLGQTSSWPNASYPCDGFVPAAKLGAGLMSNMPQYDAAALSARLDIIEQLDLGGPLHIWVDNVPDVWLPLLARFIGRRNQQTTQQVSSSMNEKS